MPLMRFLRHDYANSHDAAPATLDQMAGSIRRLQEFLGRPATLEDLTTETIAALVAERLRRVKPRTARNVRDNLMMLANFAVEIGRIRPLAAKVRRPKVPETIPTAWTLDELRRLRAACDQMPRPLYWRTLIDAAYDTGLRCGDLLAFDMDRVREEAAGAASVLAQSKTGHAHRVWLAPETLAALRELGGRFPLEWPGRKRMYWTRWERLRTLAGVAEGATQKLRRTAATYVERDHPGMAPRFLGHRDPQTAYKHYVDQSIAGGEPVRPSTQWRRHDEPNTDDPPAARVAG